MNHLQTEIKSELLEAMLNGSQVAAVVTDPEQQDNPIIYYNETFAQLTGYAGHEIIGRNCRFLQGDHTDRFTIGKIKQAIENREKITVTLENYRKDGTRFWNRLNIEPVTMDGHLYFIGTQTDITNEVEQQVELNEKEQEINEQLLPILPIDDNIGAVALVGKMNNLRFDALTSKLSHFVRDTSTKHIIIDVTGVLWEKNFLYSNLLMIQDVLRLMGSKLYISGISPKTAIEIVSIKDDDQNLLTFSTVQQVIQRLQAK
ncbi:PAS domain-containing protein [Planococcus maritimus]|nr:PAS domain-containing protein [Planococcus sp. SK3692]MDE4085335.1 PAS domain-containing protein [Planococcus maritimus]